MTRPWMPAFLLVLLNTLLNWRILLPGVTVYRGSIESGYAYMGKIFAANPDYLSWNPLQYCGIPMHFVYLPLVPYLDALFMRLLPDADATNVHRVICSIAVFVTPAVLYWLLSDWTRDNRFAMWAAIAMTFLSPLYRLIEVINLDRGVLQAPWRIQVLIKYGEGPHGIGLVFFFLALLFVRRAALSGGRNVFYAAISLAATVLSSWVAGLALAFAVLMLLLVHMGDAGFHHRRVIFAGLIGYGFACFWLTPSFVSQMAYNWPQDAFGFQFQRIERLSMITWAIALVVIRVVFMRFPAQRFLCWTLLCGFGFGMPVMLFYRYGVNPFPESRRYALEFELFVILIWVAVVRMLRAKPDWRWRWAGTFVLLVGLLSETPHVVKYATHFYANWNPVRVEDAKQHKVAAAIAALQPRGRVFASGETRFRLNAWYPIPQAGGVFESGLKSRAALAIAYQLRTDLGMPAGREGETSVHLLHALGAEYVVVHDATSDDFYRDFKNPKKFEGVLEKVWSDGGDAIYRVPDFRFAMPVTGDELPRGLAIDGDRNPWRKYSEAVADKARPQLDFRWRTARHAAITGALQSGATVAINVPHDPNWRAYLNGQPVPLAKTAVDTMVAGPLPAAGRQLDLRFEPSTEEYACAAISILTILCCLGYSLRKRA